MSLICLVESFPSFLMRLDSGMVMIFCASKTPWRRNFTLASTSDLEPRTGGVWDQSHQGPILIRDGNTENQARPHLGGKSKIHLHRAQACSLPAASRASSVKKTDSAEATSSSSINGGTSRSRQRRRISATASRFSSEGRQSNDSISFLTAIVLVSILHKCSALWIKHFRRGSQELKRTRYAFGSEAVSRIG